MRTTARETAFKIIFASRFNGTIDDKLCSALEKAANLTSDDMEYVEKVISIVKEHEDEFLKIIDEKSKFFPQSRLFAADKSLLILALAEILYMPDIPNVVSVNEAANIASVYSTPKSADFISGILADVLKE